MDVPGSKFTLPLPFCSIQALRRLGDGHPHWEATFFIQSPGPNASLPETSSQTMPRNNVLPCIWVSLSRVKLSHKINHHQWAGYSLDSLNPDYHLRSLFLCWRDDMKRPWRRRVQLSQASTTPTKVSDIWAKKSGGLPDPINLGGLPTKWPQSMCCRKIAQPSTTWTIHIYIYYIIKRY